MFKFNTSVLKTDLWSTAARAPFFHVYSFLHFHTPENYSPELEKSRAYWLCGILKICRLQQLSAAEIHCSSSTVCHS